MLTTRHKNPKPEVSSPKPEKAGSTLIEAMIYGFLFSIFLMIVTQVFLAVKSSTANSKAVVSLQENYARLLGDFSQTIRSAESVSVPLPGETGPSLSLDDGLTVYRLEEGVLEKTVNGATLALTDDRVRVENLSFERLGGVDQKASLKIRFDIISNYLFPGERVVSEAFQTAVTLR